MKTTSLRRLACLSGTLVVLAVPGVSARAGGPAGAPPAASPAVALAVAAPAVSQRFTPGYAYWYDVDVSHEARLSSGGPEAARPLFDHRVRGVWSVSFVAREGGVARFRAALGGVTLEVGGVSDGGSPLLAELALPFWLDTDGEGRIVALHFERAVGDEARGLLKTIAASLQLVMKPDAAWTTPEQDATGEYEARYTRGDAPGQLRKTRTRYTRLATGLGLRPAAEVGEVRLEDDVEIRVSADDVLASLVASTTTDLRLRSGLGRIHGSARVSAVLVGSGLEPGLVGEFERRRPHADRVEMSAALDQQAREDLRRAAARNLIKDASLSELVSALGRLPSDAPALRGAAIARLGAGFVLRPADAHRAALLVNTASPEDGAAITAGLGGAGSPEAQRALVEISRSSRPPKSVRLNALAALALLEAPTRETAASLTRLQGASDPEVRSAAILAAGGVARALKSVDAETADRLVSDLIRGLGNARAGRDRLVWLRALGNAGDPRVLPVALDALADDDAVVRVAALASVRFVAGLAVDDLLAHALTHDPDPRVRLAVIGIIEGSRAVGAHVARLGAVLQIDASPAVRRAAVRALGRVRTLREVASLLQEASTQDASEDVRAGAAAVLASPAL